MHDLEGVEHPDSHDQLLHDARCVVFVQEVVVLHELEQVLALHQLSDDVDMGLGLDALLELQQQRVGHDLHDGAFVAE